jgi:hypothetical protein
MRREYAYVAIFVLCCCLNILPGALAQERAGGEVLTNAMVIKMVQANLGDSLVIAKIKNSPCQFDTSVEALLALKQSGVSEAVIQAMVEAAPALSPAPSATPVIGHWRASTWLDYPTRHEEISEAEFQADGTFTSVAVEGLAKGFSVTGTYKMPDEGTIETTANGYTSTAAVTFEGPDRMVWRFSDGRESDFVRESEAAHGSVAETEGGVAPSQPGGEPEPVPGLPDDMGVYYRQNENWVALLRAPMPTTKSKSHKIGFITLGIPGVQTVNVYRDAEAPIQIEECRPQFFIRTYGYAGIERDWLIVRFEKDKDERRLQITQGWTPLTTYAGYRESDMVRVKVTRLANDVYAVVPEADLSAGEYLLTAGGAGDYDFGTTCQAASPQPE